MRVIGITGRSGCGKSTVTRLYAAKGYPCLDADAVARQALQPGSPCIKQLQKLFGSDIVEESGAVRRRLLADRAFATREGTRRLTAVTHPEILRRIDAWIAEARAGGATLAFVDGAVIVGTPFEEQCDAILLVTAPYETSVARICERDGISPAMARRRLDAQTPEAVLRAAARYVLENNETPQRLEQKALALLPLLGTG